MYVDGAWQGIIADGPFAIPFNASELIVRPPGEGIWSIDPLQFMLTEYSELSYAEIAAVLSIPAGTVGSRRNRALRHLKSRLIANEGRGHERTAEDAA